MADNVNKGIETAATPIIDALDSLTDVLDDVQKALERGKANAVSIKLGKKRIASFSIKLTPLTALGLGVLAVLVTKLAVELVQQEED